MRSLLLSLLLATAGCASSSREPFDVPPVAFEDTLATAAPTSDVVAPRVPLQLDVLDPLVPGEVARFLIWGLAPGETTYVGYSLQGVGQGPCPAALGGLCLNLAPPLRLAGVVQADLSGRAYLDVPVPAQAPIGLQVALQAVAVRGFGGAQSVKSAPLEVEVEAAAVNHSGGSGASGFEVGFLTWGSQFAYDRVNNALVTPNYPYYGALPPTIDVYLMREDFDQVGFDFSYSEYWCMISFDLTSSVVPNWVTADPQLWWGVDYTNGATSSTCVGPDYELDPTVWGVDPAQSLLSTGPWGTAVGEPSATVVAELLPNVDPALHPFIHGGAMQVGLLGGSTDTIYTQAYAMNPVTHDVLVDGSGALIPLDDTQVHVGGRLAPAWYSSSDMYLYLLY